MKHAAPIPAALALLAACASPSHEEGGDPSSEDPTMTTYACVQQQFQHFRCPLLYISEISEQRQCRDVATPDDCTSDESSTVNDGSCYSKFIYTIAELAPGPCSSLFGFNGRWESIDFATGGTIFGSGVTRSGELYAAGGKSLIVGDAGYELDAGFDFTSVWGEQLEDLWIVGLNGGVVRGNVANGFTFQDVGLVQHFASIHGRSSDDIWIVGTGGSALHFDGASWSTHDLHTQAQMYGVHVLADGTAWAVGDMGTVRHWDGRAWNAVDAGTSSALIGVYALEGHVWVVGEHSAFLHFDGERWTQIDSGRSDFSFTAVFATSPNDVHISGAGAVWRWNGLRMSREISVDGWFNTLAGQVIDGRRVIFALGDTTTIARYNESAFPH